MIKNERMINGIKEVMGVLSIDRMPTSNELRNNGYSWLGKIISDNGGFPAVANELKLERFKFETTRGEEYVLIELQKMIDYWEMDRMPTATEIRERTGSALHTAISRNGGYRYFANKLGLTTKDSETKLGQGYELKIKELLESKGYSVRSMTTKHPYDLLVNESIKVDVKVSNLAINKDGDRIHTFGLAKRDASCDIYIAITLDENKEIERLLVIPSHHLKVITLCIGKKSKYDKYINKFEYLDMYSEFFNNVV